MKYTWEILAPCWTADLIRSVANHLKQHYDTVGAWKRPPASEEFPDGNGKANLIDQVKFLMRQIHRSFPGVTREIAEHISDYADELDRAEGESFAQEEKSPCRKLADVVKEHADLVIVLASDPNDRAAWVAARKEGRELVSALMKLDGCLETLIEQEKTVREKF